MKFCQRHWDELRESIEEEGLAGFVPDSGEQAAKQLVSATEEGTTIDNFDPLTGAHNAIFANSMNILSKAGGPSGPMYLMAPPDTPEDPVKIEGYEGRTWPRCPVCYLNLAHETSCTDSRCTLDKERGYDWMIERAVKEQLEIYEKKFGEGSSG